MIFKAITKVFKISIPITNVKSLGDRIKETRESLGLTQAELARASGVSQGTIGNLESGIRKSARRLLAIASALKVDAAWLLTGKGHKEIYTGPAHSAKEPKVEFLDAQAKEALQIFQRLAPKTKAAALEYLRFLASKSQVAPPSGDAQHSAVSQAHPKAA